MTLHVYVTLVTTDSYVPGALVLAHRLRDLGTNKHLACLVTPNNVSSQAKTWLSQCFHDVISVDTIKNESTTAMTNLTLLGRPDLIETLTKLHVFRLTQYDKIVFLDADTYPIRLIDDLFERPSFSAAPDIGWPDCFNSGVFVVEPSLTVYSDLIQLASKKGSFDGGDQGLLNTYFDNWPETSAHRLPFTYNTTPSASYSYAPAYVEFRDKISVAHFIGKQKPWHYQRFADGSVYQRDNNKNDHLQLWWDTWDKHFDKMTPAYLLSTTRTIPLPHYHHYPLLSTPSTSNHPITSKKENVQSIWHDITSSSISSPDKNNFSNFQPIIKNQYHRQHYHHHYKASIPEDHARSTYDTPKVTQKNNLSDKTTTSRSSTSSSSSSSLSKQQNQSASKQISSSNNKKQYIFSQKTSVAEATMLEFELDFNERHFL